VVKIHGRRSWNGNTAMSPWLKSQGEKAGMNENTAINLIQSTSLSDEQGKEEQCERELE